MPKAVLTVRAAAALALLPVAVAAAAGPPRQSPMATVSQVVGVSDVSVTYSRPAVRGRTVWGDLVPYGEVWRTGANEATTITFSDDVQVEGQPLPAGTYALFTLPAPAAWQVIFNRQAKQWGAFSYDKAHDALRVTVRTRPAAFSERFTIGFPEVGDEAALLSLRWAELEVPVRLGFDGKTAILRAARAEVAEARDDGRTLFNWANYFFQNGNHRAEILQWATRAAELQPTLATLGLQARLLAANERHAEAVKTGQRALAVAREGGQGGSSREIEALSREIEEWKRRAA